MEEIKINLPVWNIEMTTGYKPISTFWNDFSIAEKFGKNSILNTYNKVLKEWKNDYKMITELSMVLNHKIWYWYEKENYEMQEIYDILWEKSEEWAYQHLKEKAAILCQYFRLVDYKVKIILAGVLSCPCQNMKLSMLMTET